MYNSITEQVIRQTPHIDGIEPENLPQYLTLIYARIIALRRSVAGSGSGKISLKLEKDILELRKLANNLESLTVLNKDSPHLASAAFVGATAHSLLQFIRNQTGSSSELELQSQNIPSWISSILLFLIGDSPADAAEIAGRINQSSGDTLKKQLSYAIALLAKGQLGALRAIEPIEREYENYESEAEAEDYLWLLMLLGLQQMASVLLGITEPKVSYFKNIVELASLDVSFSDITVKSNYSGPYHLALLLDILQNRLLSRGVINVTPPAGTTTLEWRNFLQKLAQTRPYLWENHFEAVHSGFLDSGNSAVLTFPTGAGKTTVAELKIASSVMAGRSVLYLVPTHALEDQINRELKILFENIVSDTLEISGEFTDFAVENLQTINVMTPERCLTLLTMNPESFENIGLVVFDEFHLVNGRSNRLDKRSLDAMYCLLRLFTETPEADFLLISAMVENGSEIASWINHVTGRNCEAFNSSWKPTRQLQGCIIYPNSEIKNLENLINGVRMTHTGKSVPKALKDQVFATPHQIFSLRNKWDSNKPDDFFIRKLFSKKLKLEVNKYYKITSNRNLVAAELAAFFVNAGMKTLVFVNNPVVAKSTARNLHGLLEKRNIDYDLFRNLNSRIINSLEIELGGLDYSYFNPDYQVSVHHGLLLPAERQLNESLFKSKDGINSIVATATLAQGINLPAEVVIIAGDDRFDEDTEASEKLLAHEILNAAGRAGRAGSAAQGIVILIPGQIISFENRSTAPSDWMAMQERVFAKSDQCLTINDPLTHFLDEVTQSGDYDTISHDANSLLLRLHNEETESNSIKKIFSNSFAAYKASNANDNSFSDNINELIRIRENIAIDLLYDKAVEIVSLKSGIKPETVEQLDKSLAELDLEQVLEFSVSDWIIWFFDWLKKDRTRILEMFSSPASRAQLARAVGLKVTKYTLRELAGSLDAVVPILIAFIKGETYETINGMIPGKADQYLSKSRHFILRLVPQISFAFGVVSLTLKERLLSIDYEEEDIPFVIKNLATMVKEGFDTEEKLQYKVTYRTLLRVQIHMMLEI
jgi:ATP-dependent RNA helicase DOB1